MCCRFAATARRPCRRASRETSRRANPGCLWRNQTFTESSRRPQRHRRDACSMAWRCRFLTMQLVLVDFHTAGCPVDLGAGSGASPASRAAPGASPAARRRPVVSRWTGSTPLHFACGTLGAAPDFISVLISAGAEVNAQDHDGGTPLARITWEFPAQPCHVKILEIMLRAGASLDSVRNNDSFDVLLQTHRSARNEHFVAMSDIVASVRRHGSWKAHCIAPHRMVLRLRSLLARGRAKLPRARRRSQASASRQALYFIVRQGDNGIVWNILSYWRATK